MNDLAASNFSITVEQRIRAFGIFTSLCLGSPNGVPPADRLANFIGPIVCRNAEEQLLCRRIFAYWFPAADSSATWEDNGIPGDEDARYKAADEAARALQAALGRAKRGRLLEITFTGLSILVIAFALALVTIAVFTPRPTPVVSGTRSTQGQGPRTADASTAAQPVGNSGGTGAATPLPAIGQVVATSSAPWLTSLEEAIGPATVLVLMIPFTALALLLLSSRRLLTGYARQTRVVPRDEVRLLLSGSANQSAPGERFFQNVQPLRRRIESESTQLDVGRTIAATIDRGGIFTAVFAPSLVTPDHLVLIDERSPGDHLAAYAAELTRLLELAGVSTTVYTFDRDPRRLFVERGQRIIDFRDLVASADAQRLFVFSDGDGWIDPASGRPYEWASAFATWPERFLFTPKDADDWTSTEWWLTSRLGYRIFPASPQGLREAAATFERSIRHSGNAPKRLLPNRRRLAGLFAMGTWKWLDESAPEQDDVEDLISRLRAELGELAFTWLCATAVYPAIDWRLTSFLGQQLAGPGRAPERHTALLQIARLPWLQRARMPRWLRERLIDELGERERTVVHRALDALFSTTAVTEPKNLSLTLGLGRAGLLEGDLEDDEFSARDHIVIEFLARSNIETTDYRLQQNLLRRLGLLDARQIQRDFFGRVDLSMMRASAAALQRFVEQHPPREIVVEERFAAGHPIRTWIDVSGSAAEPPGNVNLVPRRSRGPAYLAIDAVSQSILRRRRRLTLTLGTAGFVALAAVMALVYARFFETISFGPGLVLVTVIAYAPLATAWLVLTLPAARTLRRFPVLSGVTIRDR